MSHASPPPSVPGWFVGLIARGEKDVYTVKCGGVVLHSNSQTRVVIVGTAGHCKGSLVGLVSGQTAVRVSTEWPANATAWAAGEAQTLESKAGGDFVLYRIPWPAETPIPEAAPHIEEESPSSPLSIYFWRQTDDSSLAHLVENARKLTLAQCNAAKRRCTLDGCVPTPSQGYCVSADGYQPVKGDSGGVVVADGKVVGVLSQAWGTVARVNWIQDLAAILAKCGASDWFSAGCLAWINESGKLKSGYDKTLDKKALQQPLTLRKDEPNRK